MRKLFTQRVEFSARKEGLLAQIALLPDSVILESQEDKISRENRFSVVCAFGLFKLTEKRDGTGCLENLVTGEKTESVDTFSDLEQILAEYRTNEHLENEAAQVFPGGFVGFISYDRQEHLSKKIAMSFKDKDYIGVPLFHMVFYPEALIFDKKDESWTAVSCRSEQALESFVEKLMGLYAQGMPLLPPPEKQSAFNFSSSISREGYLDGLDKVHEEIRQGRVYQINYTQRFCAPLDMHPYELYSRLRVTNPAPYAAFINTGNLQISSSSPECFIKVRGQEISTRPIKGTIKRTGIAEQDEVLAEELRQSSKDRSELLMIVDLERNDLGRVCEYGSVKVPELFAIEQYPTLFHLVSEVSGKLRENIGWGEILRAVFPGGSITGAPKLAAMQCIADLEKVPRELYTGSIGYISTARRAEFNIVIRTVICKDNKAWYSTGGGIVWDSIPESEYEESLLKGKALKEALNG